MRVLLDTQALLWFLLDDPKLSRIAQEAIADGDNRAEVSPASYWDVRFLSHSQDLGRPCVLIQY